MLACGLLFPADIAAAAPHCRSACAVVSCPAGECGGRDKNLPTSTKPGDRRRRGEQGTALFDGLEPRRRAGAMRQHGIELEVRATWKARCPR
jgi:hypothetical protein